MINCIECCQRAQQNHERQDPLLQSGHYLLLVQRSQHCDEDEILIEIAQMSQIASCVNVIDYRL